MLPVTPSVPAVARDPRKRQTATGRGAREATAFDHFVGGCFGGLLQTSVLTPTDVVKCRMQADARFKNSLHVVRDTLRGQGVAGLYRGNMITVIREVPSYGCYFLVYDALKAHLHGAGFGEWPASFLAGGFSGSITWAMVYPVDVVKSIVQTAPEGTDTRMASVVRDIVKRHGPRYFFRGFLTACVRAFPVNGVIFPTYELSLKLMKAILGDGQVRKLKES